MTGGPTRTAIGAWTALELHDVQSWYREPLHVVVARGERADRHPWLVVHESRRPAYDDVTTARDLPVHRAARAAVDAAAWQPDRRTASGLVAALVQQRIATPDELYAMLDTVGAVRHRRLLRLVLADVAGGADSLAEIDVVRLCRSGGLPEPQREVRRRDARGRWRHLDVEWQLPGGRRLVVEIDGIGHLESTRWYDDLLRDAELGNDTRTVSIRLPATATRCEPARVLAIVRRHLTQLALAA
ncbi:hypothetical protein IF650_09505 [Cellulosimicrobium terreum]|nr:hypothetical protein [Cellulosimicrobium terreum]